MPRLIIRILLFISSYFPLLAIFAVQLYFRGQRGVAVGIMTAGVAGLAGISTYMWAVKKIAPVELRVASICRKDGEAMSYIVTYLLPFISLPDGNMADWIGLGIFLCVLGVLYINSNMLHVNPMLNLAGWHLYEVELSDGRMGALLTRMRVERNRPFNAVQMSEDIFMEVK